MITNALFQELLKILIRISISYASNILYLWPSFVSFVSGSLLLESKIQSDTAYQKQQETLIVWSEGENFDLALSFQEKAGCDEIWEKICQVRKTLWLGIYELFYF